MCPKKNAEPIVLLQIIWDQCWSKHYLYYAKQGNDIILYCPICEMASPLGENRNERIKQLTDEFDFLFLSKDELDRKYMPENEDDTDDRSM